MGKGREMRRARKTERGRKERERENEKKLPFVYSKFFRKFYVKRGISGKRIQRYNVWTRVS